MPSLSFLACRKNNPLLTLVLPVKQILLLFKQDTVCKTAPAR